MAYEFCAHAMALSGGCERCEYLFPGKRVVDDTTLEACVQHDADYSGETI